MDNDDLSLGSVGRLLPDVKVKLENWEEGGYTVTDTQGIQCGAFNRGQLSASAIL